MATNMIRWTIGLLLVGAGFAAHAEIPQYGETVAEWHNRQPQVETEYQNNKRWLGINLQRCLRSRRPADDCNREYTAGITHFAKVRSVLMQRAPSNEMQALTMLKVYVYSVNGAQSLANETPWWLGAQGFKGFAAHMGMPKAVQDAFWMAYGPVRNGVMTVQDFAARSLPAFAKNCLKQTGIHALTDDCPECKQMFPDFKQAYRDGQRHREMQQQRSGRR